MKKRGIWLGFVACLMLLAGLVVQRWPTARAQPQPQVEVVFAADSYTVGETDGTVTITVTLAQSSSSTMTVDYATSNGTATGVTFGGETEGDYATTSGTLVFSPGQTSKTIVIVIGDDFCCESSETFTVTLSNPSSGCSIGSPSSTTVTILDNDSGCP